MEISRRSRRYLPRPMGQRLRTWPQASVYSLTRPLMAPTALDTLIFAREDLGKLIATHANTLLGGSVHSTLGTDSGEQVTDGGESATLALGNVVLDLIGSRHSVCLQGQVVIGDLLAH